MVTEKCTDVFMGIFWFRGGKVEGGVTWEEISMGEENFNEGAQDFLALFEKTMKN